MKRMFLLAAAALMGATAMQAQDASDLRIYINPGHGSWTSSDRPMKTLVERDGRLTWIEPGTNSTSTANSPDTTAFYESNTNLYKCLAILDRLEQYGLTFDRTTNQDNPNPYLIGPGRDLENNIVMSRTKNGPYPHDPGRAEICNRGLTEICEEVEENNFDMFIAVHSNAASGDANTVNYLAYLYRGTQGNGGDRVPGSRDMALTNWPYVYGVEHQPWTARHKADDGVLGDVTFYHSESENRLGYSGYLGVLKHSAPGFLVEGYFHTYQPSRCRAMNFMTDRIEGYMYARGIAEYFELEKESTGDIYGVVRDQSQKFAHDLYLPQSGTNDVFLPINGVTVTLSRNGEKVAEVVTDNFYNGAFVFTDLEPGTYNLSYSHPDYEPAAADQPLTVTVEAAKTVFPVVFLQNSRYVAADESKMDYPDALAGQPAGAADQYVFAEKYVDEPIAALSGKTVRRTLVRGSYAYILAVDAQAQPTLVIVDTNTHAVKRTLGTEGTEGLTMPLSDIALTTDGYLIGVNAGELNVYADGPNDVKIYRWALNEGDGLAEGNPELLAEMNHAGNWNKSIFGQSIAYSGSLADGTLLITNQSGSSTGVRLECISVVNGNMTGYTHMNLNQAEAPQTYDAATMGEWQLSISPRTSDNFVLTSRNLPPVEFTINRASAGIPTFVGALDAALVDGAGYHASFARCGGEALMTVPTTDAEGRNTGLAMYNISAGLDKARLISTTNTSLAAADAAAGTATVVTVKTSSGKYQSSAMNLMMVRGDGAMTRLTTEGQQQQHDRAHFAYGLSVEGRGATRTVTYHSTGAAPEATLVLTNVGNEADVVTLPLGAAVAGENVATVDVTELPDNTVYNWAVELRSNAVAEAGLFFEAYSNANNNPSGRNNARGGLVLIDDPAQASYGKVIVSYGYAGGIEVWNPDLTQQGLYHKGASTMDSKGGASLFRGGQLEGKAVFADWSDAGAGYWMFDPENPETLTNMLQGTHTSTGAYELNGAVIGGGATGVAFTGSGSDVKMYTFVEDYPTGNDGNVLVRYDLGEARTIAQAPSFVYDSKVPFNSHALMQSTNVEITPAANGLWVSQICGAYVSVPGYPCLVYVDYDGVVRFNMGNFGMVNSAGGGVAVSADGKVLAISEPGERAITICRVTWDGNVPAVIANYRIPAKANANEHTQMRFDPAGNLHVFARGNGYQVYTLVNANPVATTPATTTIETGDSGVNDVLAEQPASISLTLSPNPTADLVRVTSSESIDSVSVYALSGASVAVKAEINGNEALLDVSSLAKGAYIVRVGAATAKLIKK